MNQYRNFCQFHLLRMPLLRELLKISLLIILLSTGLFVGCSSPNESVPRGARGVNPIPQWFQGPQRMAPLNDQLEVPIHLFFDPVPSPDMKKAAVTYVRTTPRGSDYGYKVNLRSGRLYRRFDYCEQEDVWERGFEIHRPPMNMGIIPRLLDKTGRPQKIVVFGENPYIDGFSPYEPDVLRAKLVGGVIEQYCEDYPCSDEKDWISRMVLVGVEPFDEDFEEVESLVDLKDKIDWPEFKAFMENGQGRTNPGELSQPAYRIVGESTAKKSLNDVFKKGLHFKFEQMATLQKRCHNLFDKIWGRLEEIQERVASSRKNPVSPSSLNSGMDRSVDELFQSSQFHQFFYAFAKKYGDIYRTCSKFVRSSNVTMNSERHWRFAFIDAFLNMQRLGLSYTCESETWRENPLMGSGEYRYDNLEELKKCQSDELNGAFNQAITRLTGQKNSGRPYYHYILYDMGKGGSHEKLYTWNYSTGKSFECEEGSSRLPLDDFPMEENWRDLELVIEEKEKLAESEDEAAEEQKNGQENDE